MEMKELPAEVFPVAELAVNAMKEGKAVEVVYNGDCRIVEFHAVGTSSKGVPCARVFQVVGGANFDEQSGWKMFTLEKIQQIQVLNGVPSKGPRPGYRPNDTGMGTIFAEISNEPVPAD